MLFGTVSRCRETAFVADPMHIFNKAVLMKNDLDSTATHLLSQMADLKNLVVPKRKKFVQAQSIKEEDNNLDQIRYKHFYKNKNSNFICCKMIYET